MKTIIYLEDGAIESVQTERANWLIEKGIARATTKDETYSYERLFEEDDQRIISHRWVG